MTNLAERGSLRHNVLIVDAKQMPHPVTQASTVRRSPAATAFSISGQRRPPPRP
jgi:hypothetical protein